MPETNDPGLFRCTMPSGAELWAPGRLTRRQRILIASASRPLTATPEGDSRRVFDFELLADETLIQVATGPEAGWTLKDEQGIPVDRSRQAIDATTSVSVQADLLQASIDATRHFWPEYFIGVGDAVGEESGETEKTPPTNEKAGSGSSPKSRRSTTSLKMSATTS